MFHLKRKENIYSLENSCMGVAEAWLMHSDMTLSQTPLEQTEWFPTHLTWAWLKRHWILSAPKLFLERTYTNIKELFTHVKNDTKQE